ncbi:MAG: alpha/beta hydrolase [Labilithrix sp.]|nr:alpha/beta hydrolase [Labilithrix sp.]
MTVNHTEPALAKANGIELCWDSFGDADADPLLLVMGLGAQMIQWDDEFCTMIAERGFRVIRFDNRDVGRSTRLEGGGRVRPMEMLKLRLFGTAVSSEYKLRDMAQDAVGLLDAIGIARAHVVGVSMGGMIAQEMALEFPDRVTSLTSIMSSTGDPRLPGPTAAAMRVLLASPPRTREESLARYAETWKVLRVGSFPDDEARDAIRADLTFERGVDARGPARQFRAILGSGDRTKRLAHLKAPTLVIHGDVDPLVRLEAGRATAAAIPGAKLKIVAGMGHALPIRLWGEIVEAIVAHAERARERQA